MNSRGQHNGYGVVHDALAEKQRVQIPVSVQLVKDGQHRHCGDTKKTLKTLLAFTLMHAVLLPPARGHAWVRGRDDGAKEKAVSVVKLPRQLTHCLHQLDHAVHQVPAEGTGMTRQSRSSKPKVMSHLALTHPMTKQETAVPRKA